MKNNIPLGNTFYAVGLTILLIATIQMLSYVWLPLFGGLAVVGSGFAAEGAVNHGKHKTAFYLILGGWVTPAILMTGGLLWNMYS